MQPYRKTTELEPLSFAAAIEIVWTAYPNWTVGDIRHAARCLMEYGVIGTRQARHLATRPTKEATAWLVYLTSN